MAIRSRVHAVLTALFLAGCVHRHEPVGGRNFRVPPFDAQSYGVAYPNPELTPGGVIEGVTKRDVCTSGYARRVRRGLTSVVKAKVYAAYGLEAGAPGYQVDHLVPLSLGGSNVPGNLWLIPITENAGFKEKGQAAAYLHERVCMDEVTLADAQAAVKKDWHAVWEESRARMRSGTRR